MSFKMQGPQTSLEGGGLLNCPFISSPRSSCTRLWGEQGAPRVGIILLPAFPSGFKPGSGS